MKGLIRLLSYRLFDKIILIYFTMAVIISRYYCRHYVGHNILNQIPMRLGIKHLWTLMTFTNNNQNQAIQIHKKKHDLIT